MAEKNDKYQQMMFTPIPKLILTLSIPTIFSQLVSTAYNMVDTYFVAQLGTSVTAAVGVVNSLQSLIQAVGYGIGMGAGALISRNLGKQDPEAANKYAMSAIVMAGIAGLLLVGIGLPNISGFMGLLGATDSMLDYAIQYGRIILLAAPVMCLSFTMTCIIRYEGYMNLSTIALCAGCLLNACMDPVFIWVLDLGVAGAACSTALAETVSGLIMLGILLSKKTIIKFDLSKISKKLEDYGIILKTGLPTIFRQMMGSFSSALLNNAAKPFGDSAIAAVTVSNKIYMLVRNFTLGVGQAMQPVVGFCFGAGDKKRVKKVFNFAVVYGTSVCVFFAIVLTIFGKPVVSLFQKNDPEIIRMGVEGLRYCCLALPLLSYSTFVNQVYQVLGFAKPASFLASCRQGICFTPIILILPKLLGVVGVEMAQAASDILTFCISVPFMIVMSKYLDGKIELKS